MTMAIIEQVRVAGIASAVPENVRTLADDAQIFGQQEIDRISQNIGVRKRHVVASEKTCASDLCFAAATRLLQEIGWERDTIEALIFVTQTPDHFMPATSCLLQDRLGLSKRCAAFDVNQSCAGYIYGLWVAASLTRGCRRVLLLVGDTISRVVSPQDRTVTSLFGDAGTATALEWDESAQPIIFELGTDGSGARCLTVPAGAFRIPSTAAARERTERDGGNLRADVDLFMDGAEVFTFALREAPGMIQRTLAAAGRETAEIDAFVLHQANRFMIQQLTKRLRIPPEKAPLGLTDYGNTSSASIPLAITTELREKISQNPARLLLAGFGAGFAWGGAVLSIGPACLPPLILVAE
ncbi:MAG TPA: ketoacyl-ACP synthase III [Pirellulales bacterium]|jgi:3-oxoacyl-[acyl-carrier-protein] synthase-3